MRCEDCGLFVSLDLKEEPEENQEPEVQDDGDSGGELTASYRIVRECAQCSREMKESTLEPSATLEFKYMEAEQPTIGHAPGCDPEAREFDVSGLTAEVAEEGGGRYAKKYFVLTLSGVVTCGCGAEAEVNTSEKVAASEMDEC